MIMGEWQRNSRRAAIGAGFFSQWCSKEHVDERAQACGYLCRREMLAVKRLDLAKDSWARNLSGYDQDLSNMAGAEVSYPWQEVAGRSL